jgi:hypothetical protein
MMHTLWCAWKIRTHSLASDQDLNVGILQSVELCTRSRLLGKCQIRIVLVRSALWTTRHTKYLISFELLNNSFVACPHLIVSLLSICGSYSFPFIFVVTMACRHFILHLSLRAGTTSHWLHPSIVAITLIIRINGCCLVVLSKFILLSNRLLMPGHSRCKLVHWENVHQLLGGQIATSVGALKLLLRTRISVVMIIAIDNISLRINSWLRHQILCIECHRLMYGYPVS